MKEDQYSFLKEKIKSKDFNSVFVLVDENTDKHCLDVFINKSLMISFKSKPAWSDAIQIFLNSEFKVLNFMLINYN